MSSLKLWLTRAHTSSGKRKNLEDHLSFQTELAKKDLIMENLRKKELNIKTRDIDSTFKNQ